MGVYAAAPWLMGRAEALPSLAVRRMVFNILADNTDDHEKNHVLPAGQALGYQQMRVSRDGADATVANALSEHRSFALTLPRARQVVGEVARAVEGWRAHFAQVGVRPGDIELLAMQIDRPFLAEQRGEAARG